MKWTACLLVRIDQSCVHWCRPGGILREIITGRASAVSGQIAKIESGLPVCENSVWAANADDQSQ